MILTSRFRDALMFAAQLHDGQLRKGSGTPYLAHLLAVASIALDYGANEDEAIAALLHDAIEDQGGATTREKIHQLYGDTVADIVSGCSDSETIPKPPWRMRKQAYIEHLKNAGPSICLVSASDKLHNARSILTDFHVQHDALWDRFTGGREGTLWYYQELVHILRGRAPDPLVDELERVVNEILQLAK